MTAITENIRKVVDKVTDDIHALRVKIRDLKLQSDQIARAPIPLEEAMARIDTLIAARARDFSASIGWGGLITPARPDFSTILKVPERLQGKGYEFCWLFAEAVRNRLQREIEDWFRTHPPGLPDADRRARLSEIDNEILLLELEEENLIRDCETAGFGIDRRTDADPRVILGMVQLVSGK